MNDFFNFEKKYLNEENQIIKPIKKIKSKKERKKKKKRIKINKLIFIYISISLIIIITVLLKLKSILIFRSIPFLKNDNNLKFIYKENKKIINFNKKELIDDYLSPISPIYENYKQDERK